MKPVCDRGSPREHPYSKGGVCRVLIVLQAMVGARCVHRDRIGELGSFRFQCSKLYS